MRPLTLTTTAFPSSSVSMFMCFNDHSLQKQAADIQLTKDQPPTQRALVRYVTNMLRLPTLPGREALQYGRE
jgi:hypothetical protein